MLFLYTISSPHLASTGHMGLDSLPRRSKSWGLGWKWVWAEGSQLAKENGDQWERLGKTRVALGCR